MYKIDNRGGGSKNRLLGNYRTTKQEWYITRERFYIYTWI